jgi:hypothetical protein
LFWKPTSVVRVNDSTNPPFQQKIVTIPQFEVFSGGSFLQLRHVRLRQSDYRKETIGDREGKFRRAGNRCAAECDLIKVHNDFVPVIATGDPKLFCRALGRNLSCWARQEQKNRET